MDLGNSLAYWVQADDDFIMRMMSRQPTHLPGMLTRQEVVEYYCEQDGLQAGELRVLRGLRSLPPRGYRAADLLPLPSPADTQSGVQTILARHARDRLAVPPPHPEKRVLTWARPTAFGTVSPRMRPSPAPAHHAHSIPMQFLRYVVHSLTLNLLLPCHTGPDKPIPYPQRSLPTNSSTGNKDMLDTKAARFMLRAWA